MTSQNEDLTAIERIRKGDADSFAHLYEKYRDRVYGFAYRMLGTRSTAEDVTHDAFLVIIQHPEKYQAERGSVLTFLCVVARNNILNRFRRRGYEAEGGLDGAELEKEPEAQEYGPLASLLERELTSKVDECIAALPPLQREVIILRKFQELSYHEISEVVGADVSVVKARLHRARQSLAKSLAPYVNRGGGCI